MRERPGAWWPARRALLLSIAGLLGSACAGPSVPPGSPDGAHPFGRRSDAPLEVVEERAIPRESHTLVLLSFAGEAGGRVPAALWLPDEGAPAPGILLAHGMPGDRRSLGRLAEAYADAGVAVLSITAPWGRADGGLREPALFTLPHFDERDRVELVRYVADLRRALDVLAARPGVDAGRLAFVGHSYGATAGAILAGLDHRPRAFVLAAGVPALPDRFLDPDGRFVPVAGVEPPPDRVRHWVETLRDLDATAWVARHRRPLLFQLGRFDALARPDAALRLASAATGDAEVRWYDAGHRLSPAAWAEQARWLAAFLAFPTESFEPPATLVPGGRSGPAGGRPERPLRRSRLRSGADFH